MQLYTKTGPLRETADCPRPDDRFSRRLCQLLLFVVVIPLLTVAARGADGVSVWSRERLVEFETPRILAKADRYLHELPRTVTADRCERSEGGLHDYYSEGDYWWPNPEDPDGPYVRRDGETNPDLFYAHRHSLVRLSEIMGTLTSAYLLTGDERYAAHAARHLRAWFVDEETFMNPRLLYKPVSSSINDRVRIASSACLCSVISAPEPIAPRTFPVSSVTMEVCHVTVLSSPLLVKTAISRCL